MPHHSTYRRISEEVICVEELEQMLSEMWNAKGFFGKQVLLAIDGKVLRGTLNEEQKGGVCAGSLSANRRASIVGD